MTQPILFKKILPPPHIYFNNSLALPMRPPLTHHLHLAAIPFSKIASRTKTIESRLYDEKRRNIQLGDTITFCNEEKTIQRIVKGLLIYPNFPTLIHDRTPEAFGWNTTEEVLTEIEQFYTPEQQAQYGVVGILLK